MAGLVSRIKEKVHRRSDSNNSTTAPDNINSREGGTTAAAIPDSPSTPNGYRTQPRVSLENSAFHVTSTGGVRKSLDAPQDPYQTAYANSNANGQHRRIVSLGNHDSVPGQQLSEKEQGRNGAPPFSGSSHNRGISREEQQAIVSDVVPKRQSSKKAVTSSPGRHGGESDRRSGQVPSRKPLGGGVISNHRQPDVTTTTTTTTTSTAFGDNRGHVTGLPADRTSQHHPEPSSSTPRTDGNGISSQPSAYSGPATIRPVRTDSSQLGPAFSYSAGLSGHGTNAKDQETHASKPLPRLPTTRQTSDAQLFPDAQLAEQYLSTSREQDNAEMEKAKAINSGHLKLPSGFNLHNTEQTHVTEKQRPAVVHETIIKKRTEIIQEAITRDIHVHHYYTYLQPIRVVEILPARHFFLDLQTGIKTEVLPPSDWQIPADMQPISPDTSMIKSTTRHYLVDEEHPRGILEPPPLKHEEGHQDLREEANLQRA